jgi:hypothetical protein
MRLTRDHDSPVPTGRHGLSLDCHVIAGSLRIATTMSVDVTATSPADWKYVSEGGSTIVFSYVGPVAPYFTGTVIRLRKTAAPSGDVAIPVLHEPTGAEEPDDPTIIFQHQVTQRLIPPEYLPRLVSVRVDEPWLQKLSDLSDEHRPEKRRAEDSIAVKKTKAVLADNLVGGEGFVVEIKVSHSHSAQCVISSPGSLSGDSFHLLRISRHAASWSRR